MGIFINLDIFPNRINAQEWQIAYEESVLFLQSDLVESMGIQTENIYSLERTFFSRKIEHKIADPAERFWNVVGDFKTKERAESFILHYDLSYYLRKEAVDTGSVITSVIEGRGIPVFADKTQGYSYHIPMLAVAMLIEDRFPNAAMVSGDINIQQAVEAQVLLKQVLQREVKLPIAVVGERLYSQLLQEYPMPEAIEHFDRVFRGDSNVYYQILLELSPKEAIRAWWMMRLKQYESPIQLGAMGLMIEWLNATQDLQALCEMACLDSAGPQYDPVELSRSLANSWTSIDLKLRLPKENLDGVDKQFLAAFMDMSGFKGRNNRIYMEESLVLSVFNRLFPEYFPKMEKIFKKRCAIEKKKLLIVDSDLKNSYNDDITHSTLLNPPISDEQKIVYSAAYLTISVKKQFAQEFLGIQNKSIEELKINIIRIASLHYLVFTEDAWEWIDVEENRELLELVSIWVAIKNHELRLNQLRRALLESRELCYSVLNLVKNTDEAKILEYLMGSGLDNGVT